MREILFRGKRVDNGEWRHGYLVVEINGCTYIHWTLESGEKVRTVVHPETVEIKTDNGEYKNIKEVKIG